MDLSRRSRIFLKLENLQPSGSFKSRGIGNYCQLMANPAPQETHFYASSGGNAGLACVVAAKALGHKATVVVPTTTKPMMIAKIMAAGADNVIQHGNSVGEADTYLKNEIMPHAKNGVYTPPYDHPVNPLLPPTYTPQKAKTNSNTVHLARPLEPNPRTNNSNLPPGRSNLQRRRRRPLRRPNPRPRRIQPHLELHPHPRRRNTRRRRPLRLPAQQKTNHPSKNNIPSRFPRRLNSRPKGIRIRTTPKRT